MKFLTRETFLRQILINTCYIHDLKRRAKSNIYLRLTFLSTNKSTFCSIWEMISDFYLPVYLFFSNNTFFCRLDAFVVFLSAFRCAIYTLVFSLFVFIEHTVNYVVWVYYCETLPWYLFVFSNSHAGNLRAQSSLQHYIEEFGGSKEKDSNRLIWFLSFLFNCPHDSFVWNLGLVRVPLCQLPCSNIFWCFSGINKDEMNLEDS